MAETTTDLPPGEAFLAGLPRFTDAGALAYRPGLERIRRLLAIMGHPQDQLRSIHVAGTNGKGSTASVLAAVSTAAGRKTGLHTSPHLFHVTERMRIDGAPAPRAWLETAIARYRRDVEKIAPSFFECMVALSLLYFAEEGVDLAVVEVGMGGRLDATNLIEPELCIITPIGLDHAEFLGQTVDAIAREKAGIIKPRVPVLTSASQPDALRVIESAAREAGCALHVVSAETEVTDVRVDLDGTRMTLETPMRKYERLEVSLRGRHQIPNVQAAVMAAELTLPEVRSDPGPIFRGVARVEALSGLRGRLDVLQHEPLILADVAHNPDGLATALEFLREIGRDRRLTVALGVMKDKDVVAIAHLLRSVGARAVPVEVGSPRAWTTVELAARLRGCGVTVADTRPLTEVVGDFASAAARSDTLLLTGSHLVVARLSELNRIVALADTRPGVTGLNPSSAPGRQ